MGKSGLTSPLLVIVSAPSGAGKTTLCARLLKDFPQFLTLSISTTTRAPRGTEKNGVEYFFVSQAEFKSGIDRNEFAEWAEVHGNYYGTSRAVIEQAFSKNLNVLLDIDVQGAESLRKAYPGKTLLIFIAPPSIDTLKERLDGRGTETAEAIQKRIKNAEKELERSHVFDHAITNDDLDKAYQKLKSIFSGVIST
jgi:guanylate kinase